MTKEVEIRFVVEDDTNVDDLITAIGENLTNVLEAVPLENTGFAHLLPVEDRRQRFTS